MRLSIRFASILGAILTLIAILFFWILHEIRNEERIDFVNEVRPEAIGLSGAVSMMIGAGELSPPDVGRKTIDPGHVYSWIMTDDSMWSFRDFLNPEWLERWRRAKGLVDPWNRSWIIYLEAAEVEARGVRAVNICVATGDVNNGRQEYQYCSGPLSFD
jgi:hypothetical protein